MAVDPMIARGAPGIDVSNTLAQIAQLRQRDAMMQQQQQQNALMQQRQQRQWSQEDAALAEDDEDDAKFEAARAAGDWNAMALIDPQTTKVLWDFEQARNQQPKRDIRSVGNSLLEIPTEGDPRVLYQAPQSAGAGHGAMQEPFDVQTYRYYLQQPPEVQAQILEYRRGNSTPEIARDIAAAKTTATEQAKASVAAQTDLPRVEANASDMLNVLDQLEKAPGFDYLWGAYSLTPYGAVPGTSQADALAVWEQVQGKAFLEAFNTLKGGGQITEKEGEKATAAITRLASRKQSAASARAAIRDLRAVVQSGVARAKQKAGQPAGPRQQAPDAAVEYLRQHPESAAAFKAKYGYLP